MGAWTVAAVAWLAGVALQLQQAQLLPAGRALVLLLGGVLLAALAAALAWMWSPARRAQALSSLGAAPGRARAAVAALLAVVPAAPSAAMPAAVPALLLALSAATLGYASTELRAATRLAQALPAALEGRDLIVTGLVASLPRRGADGLRFEFEVESATLLGASVHLPPRLSLGWYRGFGADAGLDPQAHGLRAGQRWRLPVRLRQPHASQNPHGFDLELWLFDRGLRAGGQVRSNARGHVTGGDGPQLLVEAAGAPVERAREALRQRIGQRVSDTAVAGVMSALLVGDQAAIERADWDVFRITGVAHLMSISGLHVTLFAWLAARLIGPLWRRSRRLALACPTPLAARWGGLAAAAAYSVLAGWGVPAQRTVWMIASVVVLRSLGLRWPLPLVLLAAALVVTLADPWALLQPGFWLSFVAVALLVASDPVQGASPPGPAAALPHAPPDGRQNTQQNGQQNGLQVAQPDTQPDTLPDPLPDMLPDGLRAWPTRLHGLVGAGLRTQAIATVGLAPLTLLFFHQLSVVGFVANLVAIPLVTLLVVPLTMVGALLPWAWDASALLLAGLMAGLRALSAPAMAVWQAGAAPPWAVVAGLLAAVVAVLPWPWRLRLWAGPLLLPLLWPPLERPAEGGFEVVAADVGQGTAVLVRTRRHLLLYDAGPQYGSQTDAGQRVLLPLLRARAERRVHHLVLSHGDADHIGGAASLLDAWPVGAASSSLGPAHPLRTRLPQHRACEAGQRWVWDGVTFEVLHPPATDHQRPLKTNAVSCVLRVASADGRRSLLLTGDIEAAQEAALVQRLGAGPQSALASTVLLVPHHGSRTSSTAAFLDAVAPQLAVVQAAYRSRFGHPAPDVVQRYEARGITLLRSDRCGAWTWPAGAAPSIDGCQRHVSRRYWHHRAAEDTSP